MDYTVNSEQMMRISSDLTKSSDILNKCNLSLKKVRWSGVVSSGIYGELSRTLGDISTEIENESGILGKSADVLRRSAFKYVTCESKLSKRTLVSGNITLDENDGRQENQLPEVSESSGTPWYKDLLNLTNLWKLVGEVGAFGPLFSSIATLTTGKQTAEDYMKAAKYLMKSIGKGAVAVSKGGKEGLQYAVGWNDALAKIDTSSFGNGVRSSLQKQIDGLNFAKAEGVAGKIQTATKWAGHLLTVAANGYQNYDECKDGTISAERAVGETIIESAVDIGLGMGASALVTASAGLLGVAAPAALVGIGAVALTIGANAFCKWITGGRDLGEVTADFFCDVGKGAVNFAKDVGKGIKNIFTARWKGLCGAFA